MDEGKSDIWVGVGLLCLCGFAAWRSTLIRHVASGTIAGPTFVPWLMIGCLAVLSLAMIVRALARRSSGSGGFVAMPGRAVFARMGLLALLLIGYAVVFEPLRYLPSTIVAFVLGLLIFNERRLAVLALVPVLLTGAVYLAFTQLLQVWLP